MPKYQAGRGVDQQRKRDAQRPAGPPTIPAAHYERLEKALTKRIAALEFQVDDLEQQLLSGVQALKNQIYEIQERVGIE